jgi:hypothetical protein
MTEEKVQDNNLQENIDIYKKSLESRFLASGIPPQYLKYGFVAKNGVSGYNYLDKSGKINLTKLNALKTTAKYVSEIDERRRDGKGIIFYGKRSKRMGLTLLGTFILRAAIEANYSAQFVNFSTFCQNLCYDGDFDAYEEYCEVDFLLLDGVSNNNQQNSKITDGVNDIILTHRMGQNKPTIFVSYIEPSEIVNRYSESLESYFEDFIENKIQILPDEISDGETIYDIDKLITYIKENKKKKQMLNDLDINEIITKFKSNYQFMVK